MNAPARIRLSRAKGWRMPNNAVHVGRPSRWGNPFVVGKHGTREQCAAKFYQLSRGFISLTDDIEVEDQMTMYRRLRRHITDLTGKDLACWCRLDDGPCHADILLLMANPGLTQPDWMNRPINLARPRIGLAAADIEKANRAKARGKRKP